MALIAAPRPPTPPRPTSQLSPSSRLPEADTRSGGPCAVNSLTTPTSTPSSSIDSSSHSRTRKQKRVNFSPWMDYLHPNTKLREVQPSRLNECAATKSILKSRDIAQENLSSPAFNSMITMLDSVLKELASSSRDLRYDGYLVLTNNLRAYNGVPEREELKDKMGSICQYIRRELEPVSTSPESLDTALIGQALKLLSIFIWDTEISKLLTDDMRVFVVDRSIQALQDIQLPKFLTISYMSLLATQKFSSKIMTVDRCQRVITALEEISDRVSGNNVVIQRLMIYLKLLEQSRQVMGIKAKNWIDHLLSAMFSSIKETRSRAIRFGLQAGLDLGSNGVVSDTVRDLLDMEFDSGVKNVSYFSGRLIQMTATRGDRDQVPQIWSVVILLLRGRRRMISDWAHLKEWLQVIQKCFNCGGSLMESQTHLAWNRLVFAVGLDRSTSKSMIRMLRQPIALKFRLQSGAKLDNIVKATTLSAYRNLLYYAFRPGLESTQLDLFWDEYVSTILNDSFLSKSENADQACQILSSLLWNPNLFLWNENLANETKTLDAIDLPRLDCRWIRANLSSVLYLFGALSRVASWDEHRGPSPITQVWTAITKALGEACNKEVKPTTESKQAVALICSALARVWDEQVTSLNVTGDGTATAFVTRFWFLIKTMLSNIGTFPFTETHFVKLFGGKFIIASSPHCSLSQQPAPQPAISHLVRLLSHSLSLSMLSLACYHEMMKDTLATVIDARPSLESKLDFCKNLVEWIKEQRGQDLVDIEAFGLVWHVTAELAKDILTSSLEGACRGNELHDYFSVVRILHLGVALASDDDHRPIWGKLFQVVVTVITNSKGKPEALKATKPLINSLEEQEWYRSSGEKASDMLGVDEPSTVVQVPLNAHMATDRATRSHASKRTSSKTSIKRRPRHDDSQMQFTAVESSPNEALLDSQSLTDHQKEVQKRQRDDANTTFRGLWPSLPSQKLASEEGEMRLQPILSLSAQYISDEELLSTPTLPGHPNDDQFIGSSPTPGSRNATPLIEMDIPSSHPSHQEDRDPPSSPPTMDEDLPSLNEIFSAATEANLSYTLEWTEASDPAISSSVDDPPIFPSPAGDEVENVDLAALGQELFEEVEQSIALVQKADATIFGSENLGEAISGVEFSIDVDENAEITTKTCGLEGSLSLEIVVPQPLTSTRDSQTHDGAPSHDEQAVIPKSSELDETEFLVASQLSQDLERSMSFDHGLVSDQSLPLAKENVEQPRDTTKRKVSLANREGQEETIIVDMSTTSRSTRSSKKQKVQHRNSHTENGGSSPDSLRTTSRSPSVADMGQVFRRSQVQTAVEKRKRASTRSSAVPEMYLSRTRSGRTARTGVTEVAYGVQTEAETDDHQTEDPVTQSRSDAHELDRGSSIDNTRHPLHMDETEPSAGTPTPQIRLRPSEAYSESMPTPPPSSPLVKPVISTTNGHYSEPSPISKEMGNSEPAPPPSQPDKPTIDNSPTAILSSLRGVLGQLKGANIDYGVLREIDQLMADVRKEAWEAVGRST